MGDKLKTTKGTISNLHKHMYVETSKCGHLSDELKTTKAEKDVVIEKALEWDVTCEAHMEHINHLIFILGPPMYKLLTDLPTKINTMLWEIGVNLKPANRRAPKVTPVVNYVTPPANTSTPVANGTLTFSELNEGNLGDTLIIM